MAVTSRSIHREILFEYTIPDKPAKGCVLLCPGLPSMPCYWEFLNFFSKNGYIAVAPRYKGTWESRGKFLEKSPVTDILTMIKLLRRGRITDLYTKKTIKINKIASNQIILFGSSFGGSVALVSLAKTDVKRAIIMAPVINFRTHSDGSFIEQDLKKLGHLLKKDHFQCYRYTMKRWRDLIKGRIDISPADYVDKLQKKEIFLLHGENDSAVSIHRSIDFAKKIKGIKLKMVKAAGHLSFRNSPLSLKTSFLSWLDPSEFD
jgi:pimeloyl-ACP methyl ester carboxylesterase